MRITENYRCHSETVRCSHIKPIDRRNCISKDSLNFSHFIRKTEWQTDEELRLSFRCYRVFLIMRFSSCCHDNSPSPQLPDSVCFECIGGSLNAYMPKKTEIKTHRHTDTCDQMKHCAPQYATTAHTHAHTHTSMWPKMNPFTFCMLCKCIDAEKTQSRGWTLRRHQLLM